MADNSRVLTAVDLVGIQRFIFSSNRLKDVTGASYLVNLATPRRTDRLSEREAIAAVDAMSACHVDQAVLVSGGGNAVLEFGGENALLQAREFAACYSRWLVDEAPGLDAVIVHQEFGDGFAEALQKLLRKASMAKYSRSPSVPLLGLGVTAACRETGLPANESADGEPIAAAVKRIRDAEQTAQGYWRELLLSHRTIAGSRPIFPRELDDMGRSEGQTSLIGVVHIDGNGVGRRIIEWLERSSDADDEQLRRQYSEWSTAIDALGTRVLETVVDRVVQSVAPDGPMLRGSPSELSFRLKGNESDVVLPLRPVILGGDDITFLCDGRIALDLAAVALDVFRANNDVPHLGPIGACAGVAIVHAHAPILRAWSLAEELCRSAKRRIRAGGDSGFAIDWHVGLPAPGQSIERVREIQYHDGVRSLTCRPLLLGGDAELKTESWKWMNAVLLADGDSSSDTSLRGPIWSQHRNKVKQLAPLTRIGPDEIARTLEAWHVVEPDLRLPDEMKNGFIGDVRTPLLDAAELLDVHFTLEAGR